jgi:hypothetical protein
MLAPVTTVTVESRVRKRAAPLLQHDRLHHDGDRDVLPHGRRRASGRAELPVRVASGRASGRLTAGSFTRRKAVLILLIIGGTAAAGCDRRVPPAGDIAVEWKVTPAEPAVDAEALAEVTLLDRERRPVRNATVRIEAHMSHPGMAPVIAPAVEKGDGVYTARLRLTMAGAWILFVKGDLADRRPISHRLGEAIARLPR